MNKKRSVLFIMPFLPEGGAEKVLIDILKNFDYKAYHVTLFLEFYAGVYTKDIPPQVEVISFFNKNLWVERLHRLLYMVGLQHLFHETVYRWMLLWKLRGRSFDTIVSFMEGAAVKFHSYLMKRARRNVSWVHIDLKKKHWSLSFFRNEAEELACYKKMSRIVFVSDDARTAFRDLYAVDERQCTVLHNLIDSDEINRLANSQKVEKRKFTVCMVGRLNEQKRYDRALAVARRLKENSYDVDFWILGVGNLTAALKKQCHDMGLDEQVHFLGFVKPAYAHMAQSDLILMTSESEGFSLVVAEAFCLGVPVVSTKTAGPMELLDNSKYGILVDETVDAIYQGLVTMIDNPALREEYKQRALERSRIFSVASTMEKIYQIL